TVPSQPAVGGQRPLFWEEEAGGGGRGGGGGGGGGAGGAAAPPEPRVIKEPCNNHIALRRDCHRMVPSPRGVHPQQPHEPAGISQLFGSKQIVRLILRVVSVRARASGGFPQAPRPLTPAREQE